MNIEPYIKIARPDHWTKNLLALPGSVFAVTLAGFPPPWVLLDFLLGMMGLCLAASANYVINEWLDRDFDRLHPQKKDRVCASHALVSCRGVYYEYALLSAASLILGYLAGPLVALMLLGLLLQGIIYNVRPLRLKDLTFVDVVAESVNNPIRLLVGWLVVIPDYLPPSSLVAGYWAAGAFLMTMKRHSEYRSLGGAELAGRYRPSFKGYTPKNLLTMGFFYGLCAGFFLGVFMIKNRIELLLSIPFVALLFAWYFNMGLSANTAAEHPEKLYKHKYFMGYFVFVALIILVLLVVDIPRLEYFLQHNKIPDLHFYK
jgi:decaprenyl-phosphate phosphoribosyltransferase